MDAKTCSKVIYMPQTASQVLSKLKNEDTVLQFDRDKSTEYIFYENHSWYGVVIAGDKVTDNGEFSSESVPISRANDCMNEEQEYSFWDRDNFLEMVGHKTALAEINL